MTKTPTFYPVPHAPPPSAPMSQGFYDNFVKVTEEVEGKGVIPYCRVCLDPFKVGKLVGWAYSKTASNYIGVHFECHLKPLTKDLTPDEHIEVRKAWKRINKQPCTCATDVIIQSGCQCGGV